MSQEADSELPGLVLGGSAAPSTWQGLRHGRLMQALQVRVVQRGLMESLVSQRAEAPQEGPAQPCRLSSCSVGARSAL